MSIFYAVQICEEKLHLVDRCYISDSRWRRCKKSKVTSASKLNFNSMLKPTVKSSQSGLCKLHIICWGSKKTANICQKFAVLYFVYKLVFPFSGWLQHSKNYHLNAQTFVIAVFVSYVWYILVLLKIRGAKSNLKNTDAKLAKISTKFGWEIEGKKGIFLVLLGRTYV